MKFHTYITMVMEELVIVNNIENKIIMKTLLTTILILVAFLGNAQLAPTLDAEKRVVGTDWRMVKVYNLYVSESVPVANDSIIYTFPEQIPEAQQRLEIGYEVIGDTIFQYTDKAKVELSYSRRLVLYQYVRKWVMVDVAKTEAEKMFFYVKKAKELSLSNDIFYNHDSIQAILYPVIDTIPE